MPQSPRVASLPAGARLYLPSALAAALAPAMNRCWTRAAAPAEWGLTRESFELSLERSAAQPFASLQPSASQPTVAADVTPADCKKIENYLDSLHASDLALACACGAGSPGAWDYFVKHFRSELYRAALAIADGAHARELADSLYADLYGLRERDGERKSLFEYFHGRSKLSTWLRAILSQRYVDEIRRSQRTESLDDQSEDRSPRVVHAPHLQNAAPDSEREKYLVMLQAILAAVLGALDPRDRLRMAYYYANNLTLAQIGKLLGEHEATVSRKLERTRREVQRAVEQKLRREKKLRDEQVRLCFEYAREQWPFDLMGVLTRDG